MFCKWITLHSHIIVIIHVTSNKPRDAKPQSFIAVCSYQTHKFYMVEYQAATLQATQLGGPPNLQSGRYIKIHPRPLKNVRRQPRYDTAQSSAQACRILPADETGDWINRHYGITPVELHNINNGKLPNLYDNSCNAATMTNWHGVIHTSLIASDAVRGLHNGRKDHVTAPNINAASHNGPWLLEQPK
jgi:hypothetical protein